MPSVHPLSGDELRALRALRREHDAARYVFMTERRSPMSAAGFRKMLARTGKEAKFPFLVHPYNVASRLRVQAGEHRPRHAGPSALPRAQKHPAHGALYRSPERFKNFWD
jgi:type 1 fimbriae regulatory protein FimB/type 1 fimbriae regulatory protein FimE